MSFMNLGREEAFKRAVLTLLCHLASFYYCYSFLVPAYYENKKYRAAIIGLLLFLIVIVPLRFWIETSFAMLPAASPRFLTNKGIVAFILFSQLSIALIALLLGLAEGGEKKRVRISELEKLQLETELRFLKAQMNPHFLFNTINNIYSLVLLKSDKAPESLLKLSGLLRYLLYESHGKVELQKEIEAVKAFIELYCLRYTGQMAISFINETIAEAPFIEPLVILPLVENAFKHSAIGIDSKARIAIKISAIANTITVAIENTKADLPVDAEPGGIGLENIRKRLNLVYPGRHTMKVEENTSEYKLFLNMQE